MAWGCQCGPGAGLPDGRMASPCVLEPCRGVDEGLLLQPLLPQGACCQGWQHQWAPQSSLGPSELLERDSPGRGALWGPGLRD